MLELFPQKFAKITKQINANYALRLKDVWRGVFSVLVLGYYFTSAILIGEIVYNKYMQRRLEDRIQVMLKSQSPKSVLYKLFTKSNIFINKAKRLKRLSYKRESVHKTLRENFKLYFLKG